jgi:protein-S-isoprenylcysteine O-methyltransferase Ste14
MATEYPFHTALFFALLAVVAIRMYFSGYADAVSGERQTTKGEGSFRILRVVLGLPLLLGLIAYLAWPPLMEWSQMTLPRWVRWLGVPAAVVGISFLVWVQRHLGNNFSGTVQIRTGGSVVKSGPYAYVRHPMYWSFLFIGAAIWLLTANWFLGAGFLMVILIVMVVRAPVEEQALLKAYGDAYAEYRRTTGKFFPRLSKG